MEKFFGGEGVKDKAPPYSPSLSYLDSKIACLFSLVAQFPLPPW